MRLRIYLVEDSPRIRDNLAEAMEELAGGQVVGWASTEAEAIKWLNEQKASWDLAVVDLFLLQGSGMNVIKSCNQRSLQQKVVVLTNYATPIIRERCLALGADAVFDKSVEFEAFTRYANEEVERVSGTSR
jgi:DNA-binding NarL/FixJ family response regulator